MKKIAIGMVLTLIFGKLIPVILLALIVFGLAVIIDAAVKEGKQL